MTTSLTLRNTKGSALTHTEMDANLTNLRTTADDALAATDTLTADKAEAAALGVGNTDQNMGSFTGTTIADNVSAKVGMQSLETAVETKANATAVGVTSAAANMGTYTGTTIPDNETAKQNLQSLETAVETKATSATLAATGGAALIGADDASSGAKYTTVQGFLTYLLSSVGSAIVGFIQSGTGAVARTAQSKMRDKVSPEDFGAVGDGVTDDKQALLDALQSGRFVDGNGRTYGVNGSLSPSSIKGLKNIRLEQIATDTATVNYRLLNIEGLSDFTLRDVELVMPSEITSLFNDDGAGGLYVGGVDKDTYAVNFVVDNVRVTGNGCGTGIHIRHCKRFVVSNSQVHDRVSGSSPDPTNDSQNGFEFFNCADFEIHGNQAYNLKTRLSGVDTLKWTRGYVFVECRDWIATGCRAVTADQGFDISGAYDAVNNYIGNRRWVMSGCIANGCGVYGFKCANVTREGLLTGCHAVNTGWLGFVFSPSAVALPTSPSDLTKYNTSNIEVVGCKVTNSLGTGWAVPGAAGGFRIMSNGTYPSWPRGIRFKSCHADDTQDTPVMTNAFTSDAAVVEYPTAGYDENIANSMSGCSASKSITALASGIGPNICQVTGSSTQSIPDSTITAVTWNTDQIDLTGLHDAATSDASMIVKAPGWYRLSAAIEFASNATGLRIVRFVKNGVLISRSAITSPGSSVSVTTVVANIIELFSPGDTIRVEVYQNSGGALNINAAESHFSIELIGG